MLFNSFQFLLFFPIVCIAYYLIPFRGRHIFLLAASYFFYMCWNPKYALLMLTSTAVTYFSGLLIDHANRAEDEIRRKRYKKLCVAGSFAINLGILFFFKYFHFAMDSLNSVLGMMHRAPVSIGFDIVLPVGISFYTFQALSYTMDVYRGDIYCERNFLKYVLFVSFFPQLVAGPIERSKNLLKQIHVRHKLDWRKIQSGLTLMLFGYFQKVVISDHAAKIVDVVYENYEKCGTLSLIAATILFAVQIYCDFGGYSNIARGAARVMGFELMENFDTPYLSHSVAEFWRRWHISLSSWFKDYLYIPLGGNRKGTLRKYLNLMIVFLVSGLWHGASWHFVVWGGLNGIYQVIGGVGRTLLDKGKKRKERAGELRGWWWRKAGKIVITFVLIDFAWIFFRSASVSHAFAIIKGFFLNVHVPVRETLAILQTAGYGKAQMVIVAAAILLLVIADLLKYRNVNLVEGVLNRRLVPKYMIYLGLIFSILIFGSYGPGYDAAEFIYFQF